MSFFKQRSSSMSLLVLLPPSHLIPYSVTSSLMNVILPFTTNNKNVLLILFYIMHSNATVRPVLITTFSISCGNCFASMDSLSLFFLRFSLCFYCTESFKSLQVKGERHGENSNFRWGVMVKETL